jgi:hypothetical protein
VQRARRPKIKDPSAKKAEQLERRVAQLEKKLEQAVALIEIQKKVAALLGNPIPDDPEMSSWKRERCTRPSVACVQCAAP